MDTDIYQKNGYENRLDYLRNLADEYGISFSKVKFFADVLGENEDFDGLISELEDYSEMYSEE